MFFLFFLFARISFLVEVFFWGLLHGHAEKEKEREKARYATLFLTFEVIALFKLVGREGCRVTKLTLFGISLQLIFLRLLIILVGENEDGCNCETMIELHY